MKLNIDLNDIDATVEAICELALEIGKGEKPGTGPAVMAAHLRDLATPWAQIMNQAVDMNYDPGEATIGVIRSYAMLIAITLIASAQTGKQAIAAAETMKVLSKDVENLVTNFSRTLEVHS